MNKCLHPKQNYMSMSSWNISFRMADSFRNMNNIFSFFLGGQLDYYICQSFYPFLRVTKHIAPKHTKKVINQKVSHRAHLHNYNKFSCTEHINYTIDMYTMKLLFNIIGVLPQVKIDSIHRTHFFFFLVRMGCNLPYIYIYEIIKIHSNEFPYFNRK